MKNKLKLKIIISITIVLIAAFAVYMILNSRTSYSYEDIESSIQVETAPNGDVCIMALLPTEGNGSHIKGLNVVETDENNKIQYSSAVMYVSSTVGEKYFGEKSVRPFCLISENGMKISTSFFDGQYDENGMPIPIDYSEKFEIDGVEYDECLVELYYAEYSSNGLESTFKSTPKLIWSRD